MSQIQELSFDEIEQVDGGISWGKVGASIAAGIFIALVLL